MSSSAEDLDAVEHALTRLLKKQQEDEQQQGEEMLPSDLLSRLIDEVHARRKNHVNSTGEATDESKATVVAVRAAVAAANAAQAAAESAANNSKLIELLLQTNVTGERSAGHESESESESRQPKAKSDKRLVALVKKLQRQNLVTHLILGFIVITTAVWRFKEISWILRLKKMVSNPLEVVGGIFGGEQQQQQQHKYKEEFEAKPIQLPHLELPSLFQKTEVEEKSSGSSSKIKDGASKDVK